VSSCRATNANLNEADTSPTVTVRTADLWALIKAHDELKKHAKEAKGGRASSVDDASQSGLTEFETAQRRKLEADLRDIAAWHEEQAREDHSVWKAHTGMASTCYVAAFAVSRGDIPADVRAGEAQRELPCPCGHSNDAHDEKGCRAYARGDSVCRCERPRVNGGAHGSSTAIPHPDEVTPPAKRDTPPVSPPAGASHLTPFGQPVQTLTTKGWPKEPTIEPKAAPLPPDVPKPSAELDAIPLGTAEEERQRAKAWLDTAAFHYSNEEYWRGQAREKEEYWRGQAREKERLVVQKDRALEQLKAKLPAGFGDSSKSDAATWVWTGDVNGVVTGLLDTMTDEDVERVVRELADAVSLVVSPFEPAISIDEQNNRSFWDHVFVEVFATQLTAGRLPSVEDVATYANNCANVALTARKQRWSTSAVKSEEPSKS